MKYVVENSGEFYFFRYKCSKKFESQTESKRLEIRQTV